MLFNYILQYVPHLCLEAFHHLFGVFDVMGSSVGNQFLHNKGLEELDGHLLGETALVDLELRSNNDNGTAGIVHSLTQKVLTEAALFTL